MKKRILAALLALGLSLIHISPETGIVLGSGKLEEASAAAAELGAECAVFDGELTGSQIRNISTALGGLEVIDRTMLSLEIFRSRAVTNEGKLQTELALLRYRLPRDVYKRQAWYRPAWMPAARRVAASRAATVVLPAVPATPTNCTFCAEAGRRCV